MSSKEEDILKELKELKDKIEKLEKEKGITPMPYYPPQPYQPYYPCWPCTNPQRDCINCPNKYPFNPWQPIVTWQYISKTNTAGEVIK